ncbi:type II secretion system F family protein [Actinotignum schaalii]|uniref:type II secretion system F family protein n=1 Tax=Actinotignum schaalii TaxID=59505 RepID=UPI0009DBD4C3|nr:type II secretion system F family protein [Actinotignum schaalii]WQN44495.1 type II secretion system F family protein [Actinotignum schaalii]
MGLVVGALLATGILTVIRALAGSVEVGGSDCPRRMRGSRSSGNSRCSGDPRGPGGPRWPGLSGRLGLACVAISWRQLGISIGCGLGLSLAAVLGTGHPLLAAAGGVVGLWLPFWHARHAGRKARDMQRLAWPDRIDKLLSSLRAGRTIPEALLYLATRPDAPPALRSFATHLETTGSFEASLTRLKDSFHDPVSDRVLEILRLAVRHGGHDLPRVLESLAVSLRAENRARGELLARQSWTVNAARVAALAPWLVLLLLSTRPGTMDAFTSPTGTLILLVGLGATLLAYGLMLHLGRLPEEQRVLAGSPGTSPGVSPGTSRRAAPGGSPTAVPAASQADPSSPPHPSRARRAAV